jgi:hypothetical protein
LLPLLQIIALSPAAELKDIAIASTTFEIYFNSILQTFNLCHHQQRSSTMAEIKIDKTLFHQRLSHFYSAWKADKRSGDALFNGASSILVLMGKTEDAAQFQKNNAVHVRSSILYITV